MSSKSSHNSKIQHISKTLLPSSIQHERTRILTKKATKPKISNGNNGNASNVYYWMQRDMRVRDNWALLTAQHFAKDNQNNLKVIYVAPHPETLPQPWTERYVTFLWQGLQQVQADLKEFNIPFEIYYPSSTKLDSFFMNLLQSDADETSAIICDFSPIRYIQEAKSDVATMLDQMNIPLFQVDAHNVVPCWYASDKREVGARTLRPKINKLLPTFCTHYPSLSKLETKIEPSKNLDLEKMLNFVKADMKVRPTKFKGGTEEGMKQFDLFLKNGLKIYNTHRNDPNVAKACSSMSYYLNFGHVSFQRLALTVRSLTSSQLKDGIAGFIEEGIVRRELSDNLCFYCQNYDSLDAAYPWARETLSVHENDKREYVYSKKELERGMTHDDLWNAAQLQVVNEGGMHGFLRMYWAKKILEWTPDPLTALQTAQYFNDKYALDGNDPNGFVGVGWSIMGIHDQGWKERDVFGKIRYMNYAGCKRKFKVDEFVRKYADAKKNVKASMLKRNKAWDGFNSNSEGSNKRKKTIG